MYKLQKKLQTFIVPFLSIFLFCQHAHINTRTSNRFMLFWLHHARSCVSCQTLCARIKLHITANQSNLIEIISLHTISIGEKKEVSAGAFILVQQTIQTNVYSVLWTHSLYYIQWWICRIRDLYLMSLYRFVIYPNIKTRNMLHFAISLHY